MNFYPGFAEDLTETVSIQLKWMHSFQFAGYYAAVEQGFYTEEGLDVVLKERDIEKDHVQTVLDGGAEYGISDASIMVQRQQGKPVVLLKQIFQHSPLVFISLKDSGIIGPDQMAGKKAMFNLNGEDAALQSLILSTLGSVDKITHVPYSYNYDDLTTGKVDLLSAYITNQPYFYKLQDTPINIIDPKSYGIDFYGDNLFTTEEEIENHPDRVDKMIRATLKGWEYALNNPEETIELILSINPNLSKDKLVFEARMTALMILPDIISIGQVVPYRYERIAEYYKNIGLTDSIIDINSFIYQSAQYTKAYDLPFTPEEQAWLEKNITVTARVGASPPLHYKDEKFLGISVEYLDMISKWSGFRVEYVTGIPWSDALENIKNHDGPDLLLTAKITEERKENMLFTDEYLLIPLVMFIQDSASFSTMEELKGKTISVEKGYVIHDQLSTEYPDINLLVADSTQEALEAVAVGEADAYIGDLIIGSYLKQQYNYINVKAASSVPFGNHNQAMAIRDDWPELAGIINKTLSALSQEDHDNIKNKWLGEGAAAHNVLQLTDGERAWLDNHKNIRLGVDPSWAPFEFFNVAGQYSGIASDYINQINEALGLEMKPVPNLSWIEVVEKAKAGEIDILPCIFKTPEREKYLNFTKPYISQPIVIITRDDVAMIDKIDDITGKIALIEGYATQELIETNHPDNEIYLVDDTEEALKAVTTGKVFAFIGDLASITFSLKQLELSNLKVAGTTPYSLDLSIGVRKDWSEMLSLLDKALVLIPESQKTAINNSWTQVRFEKQTDWRIVLLVSGALILIAAIIFLIGYRITRRLAGEVQERIKTETELRKKSDFEQLILELSSQLISMKPEEIDEHIERALNKIAFFAGADSAYIFRFSDDKNSFSMTHLWHSDKIQAKKSSFQELAVDEMHWTVKRILSGEIVATEVVSEMHADAAVERDNLLSQGINSIIDVPMIFENKIIGIIGITSTLERSMWSEDDKSLLKLASQIITNALRRKEDVAALQESEQRMVTVFNSAPIQLFIKDLDMRYIFVNKAFEDATNSVKENFIGNKDFDIYPPEIYNKWHNEELILLETGIGRSFELNVEEDGVEKNYLLFQYPLKNTAGEMYAIAGWSVDISDKIKVEKELKDNQSRLSAFISALPDLTFMKDQNGKYLEAFVRQDQLEEAGTLKGREDVDFLIGHTVYEFFPKEQADKFVSEIRRSIEIRSICTIEYELETSLGLRSYEARIAPLLDDLNSEDTVVWVARDITDLKRLTVDLGIAKEDAEAATRAKSDFLANMSHEIRTPMNAIIGLDSLLARTKMDAKQKDYVEKIGNSARSLLGIINDILDFSKIEAGKLDVESVPFELNEVMANLANMIGEKASEKGLELIFHQENDVPVNLIGDPMRLGQVLLNLTNNSIKFTETGEIEVSSSLVNKDEGKVLLRFEVRDTGIGLTPGQLGKLFQSFSQADTSTTRKYGGTGLGLTISKRLSELMGGEIGVESENGQGSTFFFTVLMKVGEEKERQSPPEDLAGLRVLVVDDNETSREVLSAYLKDFSFEVTAVSTGETAIRELINAKAARNRNYDLVLMDYQMPGMNGIETSKRIRNELENIEIPQIVMVTSFGREEIMRQADSIGLQGFLIKPVSPSMLYDTIMEVFGKSTGQTQRNKSGDNKPEGFDKILGAKILLVEDNEINQQVAKETLEQEGFFVDIAENGKIGVEKLDEEKSYELVLMDLQMPVMDGYEATVAIRSNPDYNDLPVVAMTADAMTGVRDQVEEVGMNDYVTKPINPKELWTALVKWIPPGERELPEGFSIDKNEEITEIYIPEIDGIDIGQGLKRVGGNKKLYLNLLLKFRDEYGNSVDEIRKSLMSGDMDTAVRAAHTVKGVAGNLGSEKVQQAAAVVETALKNEAEADEPLQRLEQILSKVIETLNAADLKQEDSSVDDRPKMEIDPDVLKGLLEDLKPTLEKRKPKLSKEIIEKIMDFELPDEINLEFEKLLQAMSKYKFKDALSILEELIKVML